MGIILDNIIFSLQKAGGISVVWKELLERVLQDDAWQVKVLDYPSENGNRQQLRIGTDQLVDQSMRWMERYREPDYRAEGEWVFHSSYFRILNQKNVRNITTIHDLTYHYYRSGLAKEVHLWQEQYAVEHSSTIVCVSEHTKKDLMQHYPHLPEERLKVVHNGVNACFRQKACDNITPFETNGYLLYVGNRSAEYKNFVCAVAAAKGVGMPLVIVGDELNDKERAMVQTHLGNIAWWNKVYPCEEELVALYNHAFCLLYPSAYEGFGLPIIEAQRTGCLVIGQGCSSIPEVMGEGGICIAPSSSKAVVAKEMSEALGEMLSGRIDVEALRAAGLENSKHYTWDETYRMMKEIYRVG